MVPWAAFGIITALSGPPLTTNANIDLFVVLKRVPHTILWMWLNTLAFTVSNQRLPDSVIEDSFNKAWRPLPSGRITETQARRLLLVIIPIVVLTTFQLGGREASTSSLLLAWMYNDLRGADESCIIRHLLNALGMASWSIGAALVACGKEQYTLSLEGYLWLASTGAITFTTVQLMDLRDQAGDRAHGRITVPIALGDTVARWSVVAAVMSWSLVCPLLWSPGLTGTLLPLVLGTLISGRVLCLRTAQADRVSWKLWGPWMTSIFLLPLFKDYSVLERAFIQARQAL